MSNVKARRIAVVVAAPLAALAAWALFRAGGVTFRVSAIDGQVSAGDVVVTAFLATLAGWRVARALESRVARPRLWWMRIGSTCFAVSLAGPAWTADGMSSVALMVLHLVTALVIVLGLAATVPLRRRPSEYARGVSRASAPTR